MVWLIVLAAYLWIMAGIGFSRLYSKYNAAKRTDVLIITTLWVVWVPMAFIEEWIDSHG